jgi:RimJ/RimL family protein N-acetyltransferase
MSWKVEVVSPELWDEKYGVAAHRAVFGEIKPPSIDRISYALLVVKDENVVGYVTVREHDAECVYWQFGGVFKKYRKSIIAVKAIETALEWQKKHSRRIVTYVENTNLPMLRFYLAYGFLIIGTRTYNGQVMCDMIKEFDGEK